MAAAHRQPVVTGVVRPADTGGGISGLVADFVIADQAHGAVGPRECRHAVEIACHRSARHRFAQMAERDIAEALRQRENHFAALIGQRTQGAIASHSTLNGTRLGPARMRLQGRQRGGPQHAGAKLPHEMTS